MSRPLFGTWSVPQLMPEQGDVGGEGAVCLWCMTPLEGQPLTNGFFCSRICATSYMVQDRRSRRLTAVPHSLSSWVPVHITEDEFVILSAALTQHGTAEAKALLETLIASRRPLLE